MQDFDKLCFIEKVSLHYGKMWIKRIYCHSAHSTRLEISQTLECMAYARSCDLDCPLRCPLAGPSPEYTNAFSRNEKSNKLAFAVRQ